MKRRDFLLSSAAATAGMAVMGGMTGGNARAASANRQAEAKLRLACIWGQLFHADDDAQRVKKMLDWGFEGVEVWGDGGDARGDLKKRLDDAGLEICTVCYGTGSGKLVSEDAGRRQEGIDELKRVIENAGELEARLSCMCRNMAAGRNSRIRKFAAFCATHCRRWGNWRRRIARRWRWNR